MVAEAISKFPKLWAASTQTNYARLAHRWQEYAQAKRAEVWADSTITPWLLSETCEPSAKHSYLKVAKTIRSAREKLMHSSTQLLSKHFCGQGALIPQRQAPPIKREHLEHPLLLGSVAGLEFGKPLGRNIPVDEGAVHRDSNRRSDS